MYTSKCVGAPYWHKCKSLFILRMNKKYSCCKYLHLILESLFCVQAEALSRPCSPCTSSSLLSRCLTDGWHQQGLHTDTRVIDLLTNPLVIYQYLNEAHIYLKYSHSNMLTYHWNNPKYFIKIRPYIFLSQLKNKASVKGKATTNLLFSKAWVNHKNDSINSEGGFSNICRHHNFPPDGSI